MATALALARTGHAVSLLERDDAPPATDPEEAFAHPRRGVPQARQTHGLLARLTQVLRERFPDVLDELFAHGAREVPLDPPGGICEPGDEEVAVLLVRRTTLEWVLRRAVLRQDGVRWETRGAVTGLVGETDGTPRVTGVRFADGTTLAADAVAVCTGRRDGLPDWLAELGARPAETLHQTDLIYLTRWYRVDRPVELTASRQLTGDLGYLKYLGVPCDGETLSLTLAVPAGDHELRRHLLDPDRYDEAAARLSGIGEVFAEYEVEPLSAIEPMGGFVNRLRRFLDAGNRPTVLGVHAVGDAHTCTNPYYGRGCSLAVVQAVLLADAFTAHDDPVDRAVTYEQASGREIEPWFHQAVEMDALFDARARREHRERHGADTSAAASTVRLLMDAGAADPVIGRGMLRVFNLLTKPHELMADPAFVRRVGEIMADPGRVPPSRRDGPRRVELLEGA
jgi:2-polyprenyl-6-methoxyphenol hydroxylase-like FAD-dependent oxidoreductase